VAGHKLESRDIVDGHRQKTLQLLWTLISLFKVIIVIDCCLQGHFCRLIAVFKVIIVSWFLSSRSFLLLGSVAKVIVVDRFEFSRLILSFDFSRQSHYCQFISTVNIISSIDLSSI